VGKAFRSGFYWLTALADAQDLARRCKGCQFFTKQQHVLAQALRTIPSSKPFAMWGLDSVGPFRMAPVGNKHILVAVAACFVHMSISLKNFSVAMYLHVATSMKAERRASLHPC
jgi:hypothetical protein